MAAVPLSYLIILTSATQYATLSAQYPNGIQIPPQQAATLYGIPIEPPTAAYPGVSVPLALATDPGARAPYGNALLPYLNTQTFTVAAIQSWGGGDFFWVGYFRMVTVVSPPAVVAKLGQRRWVDGAEIPQSGEGSTGVLIGSSRVASRTVDGRGFAYRANTGDAPRKHTIAAALQGPTSWERVYLRPRVLPVGGNDSFWEMQGTVTLGDLSAVLALTPAGAVVGYSMGLTAYPGNLLFTSPPLTVGVWSRLDLRIHFRAQNVASEHGSLTLYINGVLAGTGQAPDGDTGLGTIQNHNASQLGYEASQPAAFGSEIDLDDWISANEIDIPAGPYPKAGTPGFDLTTGSHVVLVRPTGFGPSHNAGAYTGPWQAALVNPPFNIDVSVQIDSVTPLSEVQVQTDYAAKNPTVAIATGAMGATNSTDNAATLSAIGAGVVVNLSATVQPSMLYSAPDDTRVDSAVLTIPSMTLQAIKANNANPLNVAGLLAAAEQYGNFGADDGAVSPATVGESAFGIHNAPYPHISAQSSVTTPAGQVQVHAFTYTGTGAGLQLLLDLAPHWWFVRRIDLQSSGVLWWSSMETSHAWLKETMIPNLLAQAGLTGAGQAFAQIVGTTVAANAAVGTYQVVAVSDPAMRYVINGAFAHLPALGAAVNPLVDGAFTPEAAFFYIESTGLSFTTGAFYKGIGHGAASASPLDDVVNNNVATLAAGSITSQAAIHIKVPSTAYSAWRRNDGSGNTGWFDLVTYVGNGAGGTRNIACALGGKTPVFAIVTPHNGISYMRDPSNVGLHSQTFASVDSTTGIVGGDVNLITVGVALNALGITYDVFVIASNSAAAGWGPNPGAPFNPVPTIIRPTPGPWAAGPAPVPPPDAGCISLGTAIGELAYRLGDLLTVHWTSAELTRYLLEALRVWNAITLTSRARGTFNTVLAQVFYDLPTVLPTLRPYTLKDQDLVLDLEYSLQEPPTPTTWTGTAMFSLPALTQVLQRRRDRFLYETGAVVTRETAAVAADANGRVATPLDVITLRRAAWIAAGNVISPLVRDTEWNLNAFARTWPTAIAATTITPKVYSTGMTPPLQIQLGPPPTVAGTLETLAVTLGAALDPATGVLLGIPDDYAWGLKYGALADLFSTQGPGQDSLRAQIADKLWDLCLRVSSRAAVVLDGRVGTAIAGITAVTDADRYKRGWQTAVGTPKTILTVSQNLVGLSPVPDAGGPYVVTLDVVRNQPVPVLPTDCYFEGGVAITSALLDYAEFVARFKEGPAQAQAAAPLLQSFLEATGVAEALDTAQMVGTRTQVLNEGSRDLPPTPRLAPADPRDREPH